MTCARCGHAKAVHHDTGHGGTICLGVDACACEQFVADVRSAPPEIPPGAGILVGVAVLTVVLIGTTGLVRACFS